VNDESPRVTLTTYREPRLRRARVAFRTWRRSRPFWGGLLCVLGGSVIAYGPSTAFKVLFIAGSSVWLGVLVGIIVAMMGLFIWFTPRQHQIAGILALLFSVVSLITSDYGGFLIGMILGTVGGAMAFAWMPVRTTASG
jgi:hypothetical protein